MDVTLSSILTLVPIEIREEKKHYIVEDINSGEYYEMPKICIDAITLINNRESLGSIEHRLKEKYPNEEVDLIAFAEQLIELQLIAEIDGVKVTLLKKKKEQLGFQWISPKLGKFFFNKMTLFFYISLFILNIVLLVSHPSLFPHYKDIFIFNYMVLNILSWLVVTFCTVLIHEFGHILAMRANNLTTRLEVGHRLILVVLETDMSSVWKLPSKNRNVLYLAGLCFDMVILFFALVSQVIFTNGSGIFLSIMSLVVLDTFIRLVYQCCIYMKTDLYYVFENVTGCYNLMENAQQMIKRWFPFLKSQKTEEVVFEGERRMIFTYSIFYFIGVVLTLSLYVVFYVPQLLFAVKRVMPGYLEGPTSLPFWDATLFTVQMLIGLILLIYSWRKKYLLRER
jgi:putative peptide zinc metalloprotease protein